MRTRSRSKAAAAGLVACLLASPALAAAEPARAEVEQDRGARAAELLLRGDPKAAAEAFGRILADSPLDATAAAGRVRSLIAADLWREAVEEGRAFVERLGRAPDVLASLGEALYRAGRLREAEDLLAPLAASPEPPARALLTLGLVRAARGLDDEASELIDRAVSAAPEDRHVLFWAAGAAATRARAVQRLERYLALSAGDDADRIEGARGAIRIQKALGERRVWIPVRRPELVELPLSSLPAGGGRAAGYVVEATLAGGKRLRLLVDTGSTGLFLVERAARRGVFEPLAVETAFGGGGRGRHATRNGLLRSLSFGGLEFADVLVKTTTEEIEPTGRYLGVVGLDAFRGYRVTLDLSRSRLVLESAGAVESGEPYWSVEGQMLVQADWVAGGRGLFLLDTGASRSHVASWVAERTAGVQVGGSASVRGYGGAVEGARIATGVGLRYQGLPALATPVTVSDLSLRSRLGGVEVAGYLGLDLLDGTRIRIDTRSRVLRVEIPQPR